MWKSLMLRQGSPERSRRAQHERLPHVPTAVFRFIQAKIESLEGQGVFIMLYAAWNPVCNVSCMDKQNTVDVYLEQL
jgi:hypothetical protein